MLKYLNLAEGVEGVKPADGHVNEEIIVEQVSCTY